MEDKIPQLRIWQKFGKTFRSIVKPAENDNNVEESLREIN